MYAKKPQGSATWKATFNFNQIPRPPLILPAHPAPGPASIPPGGVSPANPTPPAKQSQTLQLIASVAPRQDLRLHHGRIYLMVGCNIACSVKAGGHLNLTRHRRHLGLLGTRMTLMGARTERIALALSRGNLAAVKEGTPQEADGQGLDHCDCDSKRRIASELSCERHVELALSRLRGCQACPECERVFSDNRLAGQCCHPQPAARTLAAGGTARCYSPTRIRPTLPVIHL